MPTTATRAGTYTVPCPQCTAGIPIDKRAGKSQRTTCPECRHLLVISWGEGTILLSSYPAQLKAPRQPAIGSPRHPVTRMDTARVPAGRLRYLASVQTQNQARRRR